MIRKSPRKNVSDQVRKSSLPNRTQTSLNEIKEQFRRKVSLQSSHDEVIFDPLSKSEDYFDKVRKKTGLVYNEQMNSHFSLWEEDHIENPNRLKCIWERITESGLVSECENIAAVPATMEQILMIHDEPYVNQIIATKDACVIDSLKESANGAAVYFNQSTSEAALLSAGSSIQITKDVLEGKIQNGFALVRPPGHHASSNEFSGYCFFNNAALAAKTAINEGVKRVLIVDWDAHHGQGTQRIFYDDPRVLYLSTHRYEDGKFWPYLRESHSDFIGDGLGKGFNFNVPLNQIYLKNEDFLAIFHRLFLPVAYEFNPELVIVSCGFDAAIGCPEGMMSLAPAFFGHLTSLLMPLASGKLVVLLEGGYCLESLAESAMHTLRALLGKPCSKLMDAIGPPSESVVTTLEDLISLQGSIWKSLDDRGNDNFSNKENEEQKSKSSIGLTSNFVFKGTPDLRDQCCLKYTQEEIQVIDKELLRLKTGTCLNSAPNVLCYVYDSDMEKHCCLTDKKHPECPARTKKIVEKLSESGVLKRVLHLKSRLAKKSEAKLVHDPKSVDDFEQTASMTPRERNQFASNYNSIFINEHSWSSARLAAGCLLQVVDSVCKGESQSGLAVIRPPGHHAEISEPNGFCFFNNVCVAAEYAKSKYLLKKILILDWDVHHGNGIQHVFEDSASVLYISIHLYMNGNFFPYSKEANSCYVGVKNGRGFNINIPWSKNRMGDGDYMAAFTRIVLPVAYQFEPDLVLVSAGFDAAVHDPLGGCCVTPECFGHMTHLLRSLANGRVILALEGGYNLRSISNSMVMCAKALLGDPLPPLASGLAPSSSAVDVIDEVLQIHQEFWSCLKYQVKVPKKSEVEGWRKPGKEDDVVDNLMDESIYATPPESPLDLIRADSKSTSSGKDGLEDLVQSFSALSANIPDSPESSRELAKDEETEALEGAVGFTPEGLTDLQIAQMIQNESGMFAVVPLAWCEHLSEVRPVPEFGIDALNSSCADCPNTEENWVCLVCYHVLCGRYVRSHMIEHGIQRGHNIVLSLADLSVWCYACESYIHNEVVLQAKRSAYRSKFGEEMPE